MSARHQVKLHRYDSACNMSLRPSTPSGSIKSAKAPPSGTSSASVKSVNSTRALPSASSAAYTLTSRFSAPSGPIWSSRAARPPSTGSGGPWKPSIKDSAYGRRCQMRSDPQADDVVEEMREQEREEVEIARVEKRKKVEKKRLEYVEEKAGKEEVEKVWRGCWW
ncbi:hypothetical protein DPSP01_010346 [Paraphaeosphaeria sporulosa]